VHRRVRGELTEPAGRFPAGTAWAADDPELLLWILATLVDSALIVHERYVGALSRDERQAYWEDYRLVGRLFGLRSGDMPKTIEGLESYLRDTLRSDVLHVSPHARELATRIVLRPPVPLQARPLLELANFITVGLLPAPVRRQYGFRWDPVRGLMLRAGAEYTKRVLVPVMPRRLRYGTARTAARPGPAAA
jgi:uncharacterized protein (DUF2236 family)